MQSPFTVNLCFFWIIKEDNNCVFTADEQLGDTKKKTFNCFSQYIHICPQVTSANDCMIAGSLSTV